MAEETEDAVAKTYWVVKLFNVELQDRMKTCSKLCLCK